MTPGDVLQQALGADVEITLGFVFAILATLLPAGMFGIWLSAKLLGEEDEDLGGRAFVAGFFHRLTVTVAFWCILLMGLHETAPIPDAALFFFTNLTVAALAIRLCLPNPLGRVLAMSLIFWIVDSILLTVITAGALLAFA
jgi:hypothetical protein